MEMPAKYSSHVHNADLRGGQERLQDQISKEETHASEKQTGTSISIYETGRSNSSASYMSFSNNKGDKSQLITEGFQEKEGYVKTYTGANQVTNRFSSIKTIAGGLGSHTSVMRSGPRLRAEGLMVPPAPDAATLRCQLAALQADLESRINAEKKLESFNQQLQERLELYMKQSEENLQRAALEMNTLHEDMEQTLELEQRLAQRALALEREKKDLEEALEQQVHNFANEREFLQAQRNSLLQILSEHSKAEADAEALQVELEELILTNVNLQENIQQNHIEAKYFKLKAEEYDRNIETLIKKEKISNVVENRYRRALLQHCLLKLREGFIVQRIKTANAKYAIAFKHKLYSRHGFRALCKATKQEKDIRIAETNRSKRTLQEAFKAWKFSTTLTKRSEKVTKALAQSCLHKAFSSWKKLVSTEKPDNEHQNRIMEMAVNHYRGNIYKRFWEVWLYWITYSATPKKLKLAAAKRHIFRLNIGRMLYAWQSAISIIQIKRKKLHQALGQHKHWLFIRSIVRWKEFLHLKQFLDYLREKASHFRQLHILRAALISWQTSLESKKDKKLFQLFAFRHHLRSLKTKGITVWRQNTNYQKSQIKAVMELNQALKRAAFVFWRDYHILRAMKNRNEKRAMSHEMGKEKKSLKVIIIWWWDHTTWKRRAKHLKHLFASRWQRAALLAGLHCWMRLTFKRAFKSHLKFQNQLKEFQKHLQMKNNDDAKGEVHHILEIQNLEHTLKDLRSKLAQRSCQIESYEKALQETVDRLEGASDESCNKLSNAFEIAASLRKLLELREDQFSVLEERAKITMTELGEIQKKYALASSRFSNTLETREARIEDLEHSIGMRQAEVQEARLDLQEFQVSLDAKEIYLKKLEYELKLNSGI